jgi:hypothetical protein
MTDPFVPLSTATWSQPDAATTVSGAVPAAPAAGPGAPTAHAPETCAKPAVTLQRTGDVVTGIRVQCGCGQVIELNCTY